GATRRVARWASGLNHCDAQATRARERTRQSCRLTCAISCRSTACRRSAGQLSASSGKTMTEQPHKLPVSGTVACELARRAGLATPIDSATRIAANDQAQSVTGRARHVSLVAQNTPATTLPRPTTVPRNQATVPIGDASSVFDHCGRFLASALRVLSEFAERSTRATWAVPDWWEPPGSKRGTSAGGTVTDHSGPRRTIGGTASVARSADAKTRCRAADDDRRIEAATTRAGARD